MSARLILLRHGATELPGVCVGARVDPDLSQRGQGQALAVRARLAEAVDDVVVSPARRARATAAPWGAAVVDPMLAERDFGEWEGQEWASLWPTVPEAVLCDPEAFASFTPPGGETLAEVATRARTALQRHSAIDGRTTLLVGHAGPIRLMLCDALGIDALVGFSLAVEHGRAAVLVRHHEAWVLEALGA